MKFGGKSLEIIGGTEFIVKLGRVRNPIAMVGIPVRRTRALVVLRNGADPDCVAG